MGALEMAAARVAGGETVRLRPTGTSMVPLIRSRQLVTVSPVDPAKLEVGDIVLCRVSGTTYLHRVSAVDAANGRVQISNNRGRVNGWTTYSRVFGICTAVDGVARPRIGGKVPAPAPEDAVTRQPVDSDPTRGHDGGMTRSFPIITVPDLQATQRFYEQLGFTEVYRFPADGEPVFVTMQRGEASIGIGVAGEQSVDTFGYWVYVDDVDATLDSLVAGGAPVVAVPEDQEWGERVAQTRDPAGNLVYLGMTSTGT